MHAFLSSLGLVFLAEMGDKTQLLALFLATRFRRPWPVVAGILLATVCNHVLASLVGIEVGAYVPEIWLKWGLGLSFLAMGAWTLVPDKLDAEEEDKSSTARGAFLTTLVSFFFVEMGDKTQIATVALAAQFKDLFLVASGTTIGMMLADAPVVFLGEALTRRIPAARMRLGAACLFVLFGLAVLFGW